MSTYFGAKDRIFDGPAIQLRLLWAANIQLILSRAPLTILNGASGAFTHQQDPMLPSVIIQVFITASEVEM